MGGKIRWTFLKSQSFELKSNIRENKAEKKVIEFCLANSCGNPSFFNILAVVSTCVPVLFFRWVRNLYYCFLSEFNFKMFSSPAFHLSSHTLIVVISSTFPPEECQSSWVVVYFKIPHPLLKCILLSQGLDQQCWDPVFPLILMATKSRLLCHLVVLRTLVNYFHTLVYKKI